jgi:hypothetical protein
MATKKLLFISEAAEKTEKTTVSSRIEKALYDDFVKAKELAKSHGKELRISDVIETAIKLAVDEVNKTYGQQE